MNKIMHCFIKGLRPNIQQQVIRAQPASLEEAVSAATAVETTMSIASTDFKARSAPSTSVD